MKSLLVEFYRYGKNESGMLRAGDYYLVATGQEPVAQVEMPIGHVELVDYLDALRYEDGGERERRDEALTKLAEIVAEILGPPTTAAPGTAALQLDLVTNPAELSALPFEAALGADGMPLFAAADPTVVLTRRVRRGFHGSRVAWWTRPRVLFVTAAPGAGGRVPAEEHLSALREALNPWTEPLRDLPQAVPDERRVLTIVERASLTAIHRACADAADEGRPFTHVHVLAHGTQIGDGLRARFGLELYSAQGDRPERVSAEQLCEALGPIDRSPVVVTLAACDAGNQVNSIGGGASVAHALHRTGVPIVIASQLPLTFAGSITLTREFYRRCLAGDDVRTALHAARTALHAQRERIGHDWASVVAYVELPEDYTDRLHEVALQAEWASLETVHVWSDHLINHHTENPDLVGVVIQRLAQRIDNLQRLLTMPGYQRLAGTREENLGLLGSAEKRLAELHFREARLGTDRDAALAQTHAALERAHGRYAEAFRRNLSHHWTGVQQLSLEAVLTGRISRIGQWYAAHEAAEANTDNPDEVWAYGSLAELHMLAAKAGQAPQTERARTALIALAQRVRASGCGRFPIDSTRRQLRRYVDWWTSENGFFGGNADLAAEAGELLEVLVREYEDGPRVVVASGHLVDAPDRARPRFPPAEVPRVTEEIRRALNAFGVGPRTTIFTGGARGADILVAEEGLARGARLVLCLALPPDEFKERSVALVDADWGDRFQRLLQDADVRQLADEVDDVPEGDEVFGKTNEWMIDLARRADPEPRAIIVWDGRTGEGPGGTQDFVSQFGYHNPDPRVVIIDPTPRVRADDMAARG